MARSVLPRLQGQGLTGIQDHAPNAVGQSDNAQDLSRSYRTDSLQPRAAMCVTDRAVCPDRSEGAMLCHDKPDAARRGVACPDL